jgi:sporulation protein YlmC with PRC-barrel domain
MVTHVALIKLSAAVLPNTGRNGDLRGCEVLDRYGDVIGEVEDVLVDDHEGKARFLEVHHPGIVGIGARSYLLPVDVIIRVDRDCVYINKTREFVTCGPSNDAARGLDRYLWSDLYAYYGCEPS